MNDKDVKEIRRGLAYFSLATTCCVFYCVTVMRGDSEGLYAMCNSLFLAGGLLLYLAAAIAFFPLSTDDDK